MRHQKKTIKLGRTAEHRKALLANQVCSLIEHQRIKTTLAKAKAVRPLAERMVTLGKSGSIHARRTALATLRQKNVVKKKPREERKAKRKTAEPKPERTEPERVESKAKEPAAKEEKPAEPSAPAAEPQPKKRRWFGRKSSEEK